MRVIYGNEVNTIVEPGVTPEAVIATLKGVYSELSNSQYNITTEGGEEVMRITLESGGKAQGLG